jgi:uncharacterized protein YceK
MRASEALALAALLALTGCATLVTQLQPRGNCDFAAQHLDRSGCGHNSWIYSGSAADRCWFGEEMQLYAWLDLPLSLVADTLFLPLAVYRQSEYGDRCPAHS